MARTELRSGQVKEVGRSDLDTATPGNAVVSKIVAGTGVSISSTGADTGTGDVTVNATTPAGIAVLDFGAFPGGSDASVAVAGQAGILAGSVVDAWLNPVATADHTADEHLVETIDVRAGTIVAGTGFTIRGLNNSQLYDPSGIGTRIWGQWSVAWSWV